MKSRVFIFYQLYPSAHCDCFRQLWTIAFLTNPDIRPLTKRRISEPVRLSPDLRRSPSLPGQLFRLRPECHTVLGLHPWATRRSPMKGAALDRVCTLATSQMSGVNRDTAVPGTHRHNVTTRALTSLTLNYRPTQMHKAVLNQDAGLLYETK